MHTLLSYFTAVAAAKNTHIYFIYKIKAIIKDSLLGGSD